MRFTMRQFVDNQFDGETVIEKTARLMFESIERSDVILAVVAADGSCISSQPDVFGRVFSDQHLLEGICSRVDDGQELVISQAGNCVVAASDIVCGNESVGYCIMLLAECSPEKSFEYVDFIEIILKQFSTLADLFGRDSRPELLGRKFSSPKPFSILAGTN